MCEALIRGILYLSAISGAAALLLLLFRPLTQKHFGAEWQYYIWLVPLVILLLPVQINLHSVMPGTAAVESISDDLPVQAAAPDFGGISKNVQTAPVQITAQSPVAAPAYRPPQNAYTLVFLLWITGVLVFFLCTTISYARFLSVLKRCSAPAKPDSEILETAARLGMPNRIRIRVAEDIPSPFLAGIFRPRIYLPAGMDNTALQSVLLHELTHYRRRDLWIKWFAVLVNAVYWFNPLVYVVRRRINEDCEISCDRAVTRQMDTTGRRAYMETIYNMLCVSARNRPLTTAMCGGKQQMKRRFIMIKQQRNIGKIFSAFSFGLAVLLLISTVFVSGVLADALNLYVPAGMVEATYGGAPIHFVNAPFEQDGEVYLPFKETLLSCGHTEQDYWEKPDGSIRLALHSATPGYETVMATVYIGGSDIYFDSDHQDSNLFFIQTNGARTLTHPILEQDGVVYAPIGLFVRIKNFDIESEPHMEGAGIVAGQTVGLLRDLQVVRYDGDGTFDILLSLPVDITGPDRLRPEHYYSYNEKVLIGTRAEQEAFGYNPKDENGFRHPVKRILVNDAGEVIAVVPVEFQRHETLNNGNIGGPLLGTYSWDAVGREGQILENHTACAINTIVHDPVNTIDRIFYIPTKHVVQLDLQEESPQMMVG